MSETDVVILAAWRTPIGSFNGSLSSLKAHELGGQVLSHLLAKLDGAREQVISQLDDVIIGQALTAAQGQNPARQTVLAAKLPTSVTATSINMLCGSGLKACALATQAIRCGDARFVVCGGQESMSQAPHCIHMRQGTKMGDVPLVDSMLRDGLTDAFNQCHMGNTAENVARVYQVSREEQDKFSLDSQQKCQQALASNAFVEEIVPVTVKGARGAETVVSKDEFPKSGTTMEGLSKLRPCFQSEAGTVTAGNASGINDGAALLLFGSRDQANAVGLKPLARVVSWAQVGIEPMLMGVAPIDAIQNALKKANWSLDDVDIFEINEAFASQSVAIAKKLNLDTSKVNLSGGSIALGHPIGCSGARVLVTLVHMLARLQKKRGVASLCIGGGMGIAMCVERE